MFIILWVSAVEGCPSSRVLLGASKIRVTRLHTTVTLSGSPVSDTPPHLFVHNPHVLERLHKQTQCQFIGAGYCHLPEGWGLGTPTEVHPPQLTAGQVLAMPWEEDVMV